MDSPNASSASSHRYPDWVMLDPHPRHNYPSPTLDPHHPEEDYHATNAHDVTSRGERIDVWFRAVPPPGASRFYVRWTRRRRTSKSSSSSEAARGLDRRRDRLHGREAVVLAAHRNSIILQLTRKRDPSDFFVYTVRSSTGPPSLFRLPRCDHKLRYGDRRLDHMAKPENIGLLCDGEREEFVVADLIVRPKYNDASHDDDTPPVVAGLCVYRSCHPAGDGWDLPHFEKKRRWMGSQPATGPP